MLKKEFDFVLQDTLIYSHDGKAGITAKRLLLRAPKTEYLSLASKLSSIVMSALIKARENYKGEDSKGSNQGGDIDGETIYMLISGSIDTKQMSDFIETFKELIVMPGICLIDGKEELTFDLLISLDSRETLRLIGEYVANFLLPSIMSSSTKKK